MEQHPQTLPELLGRWSSLEGQLLVDGACAPELLSSQNGAAHLGLAVNFPGDRRFYVDFWVREIAGRVSPFVLLNTRVSDWEGKSKDRYAAILQLLSRSFPPHTMLVTFVRQSDSLDILESAGKAGKAADPQELPLVHLFESAGWSFLKLTELPEAQNVRRRHLIRFETLP